MIVVSATTSVLNTCSGNMLVGAVPDEPKIMLLDGYNPSCR